MHLAFVAALVALTSTACNTVSGAGRDIQAGGAAVSDTAETVKRRLSE
jgi:predicted small secreted protein